MKKIMCNILLCLFFLTSCGDKQYQLRLGKPLAMSVSPPPGSPSFQEGWRDGCHSIFSSYGTFFQRTWFKYRYDGYRVETDPVYYRAWKTGWWYCLVSLNAIGTHALGNSGNWEVQ